MTGLAVYAAGRELRTARGDALLLASLFVAMPVVTITALDDALPDTLMLASFGTGTLFLIRNLRTGARSDLVLAGLGLGIALGTKWYGLYGFAVLAAAWLAIALTRRLRTPREGAVAMAILTGTVILAGGFWFLRNLIEVGNPVYPAKVSLLGVTLFDAPRDLEQPVYGLSIADYFGDWGAWTGHILPALSDMLGLLAGPLLAAGLVGGGVIALRSPSRPAAPATLILAIAALLIAAFYVFLPYSASGFNREPAFTFVNVRWLAPALLLAALVAGWAASRSGRWRAPLAILATGALIQALAAGPSPPARTVVKVLLAFAVVAAVGLTYRARAGRVLPRGTPARAALGVTAAIIIAAVGYGVQRDFNRDRYLGSDPTFDWVLENSAALNVGISGDWNDRGPQPTWPMFGSDLQNRVSYVGEVKRGRLDPYPTRHQWASAVRRGGYDVLLVGTAPHIVGDAAERRWARQEGYRILARSPRFVLYRPHTVPRGQGAK
jgi:hypothetical protein